MTPSWCIVPIRWLQQWVVPPEGTEDWQRVSFQPMLYLATWVATWIILLWGDLTNSHHPGAFRDESTETFWIWGSLGLVAPLLGIGSLRLITHGKGKWRYRGLWLRLAADVGQFTSMALYTIARLGVGDFHVYPVSCMLACLLFVFHLNLRDLNRLRAVEKLATELHRDPDGLSR